MIFSSLKYQNFSSWPHRNHTAANTMIHCLMVLLPLRPARVHGVGEAAGVVLVGVALLNALTLRRFRKRSYRFPGLVEPREPLALHPQHPRALGGGRRGNGEQAAERGDDEAGP